MEDVKLELPHDEELSPQDEELSPRDRLRRKIFAQTKLETRPKKVINILGEDVEVRQPTLREVQKMAEEPQDSAGTVRLMVQYCYVPDTEEKVFAVEDAETMLDMPSGPWLMAFMEAVSELTGIKLDTAIKNSGKTQSDSPSTE